MQFNSFVYLFNMQIAQKVFKSLKTVNTNLT